MTTRWSSPSLGPPLQARASRAPVAVDELDRPRTDPRRVYLSPAEYIDSDHTAIQEVAAEVARRALRPREKARAFYYEVRDAITYGHIPLSRTGSMADYLRDRETYRASSVLTTGAGYCVSKAALYTALCRAAGIPARVAFADVVNHHVSGRRLRHAMGSDLFAWHGYSEVYLDERWVKVAPTFNAAVCQRLGVRPLEFDGVSDALLQPYDCQGELFLSYVTHHGSFHDVPAGFLAEEMPRLYPGLEYLYQPAEISRL